MMNPVPWLQMTNMISYQGLVRTFLRSHRGYFEKVLRHANDASMRSRSVGCSKFPSSSSAMHSQTWVGAPLDWHPAINCFSLTSEQPNSTVVASSIDNALFIDVSSLGMNKNKNWQPCRLPMGRGWINVLQQGLSGHSGAVAFALPLVSH